MIRGVGLISIIRFFEEGKGERKEGWEGCGI